MSEKITTPYESIMIDPNEPLILPDGTAITGRLEWFLYALCCLDYGNLPTPLSRIEVFANALITGELPDIEPQSRSEKFFFACLTGDTSDLPEPQSRSEVLLNKLATGQYDLSDVEPIQSRYELLLAYLIKNGGIGNVDYVSHRFAETIRTMYNTEEAPLKELLLSGNTEINVLQESVVEDYVPYGLDECYSGKITETTEVPAKHFTLYGDTKVNVLQDNINEDVVIPYTHEKAEEIVLTNTKSTGRVGAPIIEGQTVVNMVQEKSDIEYTPMNKEYSGQTIFIKKQPCIDGRTFTNVLPEPSIRNEMANISTQKLNEGIADNVVFKDGEYKSAILKGQTLITNYCSGIVEITATGSWVERPVQLTEVTLPVKPSTDYLFVVEIIENSLIGDETINNSLRFGETEGTGRFPAVFTSISTIPLHHIGMYSFILTTKANISGIDIFDRKQLSKHCTGGKIKFRYMVIEYQQGMENWDIPYFEGMQSVKMPALTTSNEDGTKTNILTVNEPVELRGIGDVKDELNLITSELTQRIGEFIITNDYSWYSVIENENTITAQTSLPAELQGLFVKNTPNKPLMCDKIKYLDNSSDEEHIRFSTPSDTLYSNTLFIWLNKNKLTSYDSAGIKQYIQSIGGITVQGALVAESIKTVDLTTVNQDGTVIDKPIAYKDGHIQVSGKEDSLLPSVSYEIPTTNSYYTDNIKANTIYTFKKNEKDFTPNFTLGGTSYIMTNSFTSTVSGENQLIINSDYVGEFDKVALIEGNHIGLDIPYFEGTKYFDYEPDNIKGVTLEGQTLVNIIQEPSEEIKYVIGNGEDLSGQSVTIEQDVKGLEGMTLYNVYKLTQSPFTYEKGTCPRSEILQPLRAGQKYLRVMKFSTVNLDGRSEINFFPMSYFSDGTQAQESNFEIRQSGIAIREYTPTKDISQYDLTIGQSNFETENPTVIIDWAMIIEYQEGLENLDIPYFDGIKYFDYSTPRYINSATLEGQTLVNLLDRNNIGVEASEYTFNNGVYTVTTNRIWGKLKFTVNLSPNKRYILMGNTSVSDAGYYYRLTDGSATLLGNVANCPVIFTTPSDKIENVTIEFPNVVTNETVSYPLLFEYQDGMENWYIPYFEGMKSVQMPVLTTTGKNLISDEVFKNAVGNNCEILSSGSFRLKNSTPYIVNKTLNLGLNTSEKIAVSYKTTVNNNSLSLKQGDDGNIWLYIRGNGDFTISELQIEYSETPTSYEPYKSNILMVNEDVELCGIGEVKDELNLLTGELTQRIGEYSLDGSSNSGEWVIRTDVHMEGYIYFQQELNYILQSENIAICDRLPYSNQSHISSEQLRLSVYKNRTLIGVRLSESKGVSSLDEFSEYLKSNPIKFKYPLATASIKTVDLHIINQDNKETPQLQLQTPINHITTSSDALIPVVNIPSTINYDTIIKPSTRYTLRFNQDEVNTDNPLTVNLGGTEQIVSGNNFTMITPSTLTHNQLQLSGKGNVVSKVQVIKGDVTNIEYPFFEGMNDVKFSDGKFIATDGLYRSVEVQQEVPQEIVLRGIGDVKDELDLTKGEYIQRIDEVVFDGSNKGWQKEGNLPVFYLQWNELKRHNDYSSIIECDKLPVVHNPYLVEPTVISFSGYVNDVKYPDENWFYIVTDMFSNVNELIAYLQLNPITVQYVLATPIIHKVNLTNFNKIPLYATETHYETITPSDSLIPNITIPSTLNYDVAIKPSTKYTIRANTSDNLTVDLGGTTETLINGKVTLTTPATLTHNEIKFSGTGKVKELMVVEGKEIKDNVMFFNGMKNIEIGSGQNILTVTGNETDKYQVLSTNEEIALRSLPNGVCDTLNLVTGEYVQRVGEIVFDGSQAWSRTTTKQSDKYRVFIKLSNIKSVTDNNIKNILMCDKYTNITADNTYNLWKGIALEKDNGDGSSLVIYDEQFSTVTNNIEFKQYLSQNPITVQYELATPIIHKLNISNTDQDGNQQNSIIATNDYMTITTVNDGTNLIKYEVSLENDKYNTLIKPSTKYTIIANKDVNGHDLEHITYNLGGTTVTSNFNTRKVVITTPATLEHENLIITGGGAKVGKVMIVEGDIEDNFGYFEGMSSVKNPVLTTTGKNLFNPSMLTHGGNNYENTQYLPDTTNLTRASIKQNNLIEVKPNSTLTLSCDSRFKLVIQEYDENEMKTMPHDKGWQTKGYHTLTVSANTKKVNLYFIKQDPYSTTDITSEEFEVLKNSIQLEESSIVTSYEPYKSSILTVNEEVELRGIGDVQDELNLLTGELTQRIGEVVLDGSDDEYWLMNEMEGKNTNRFRIRFDSKEANNIQTIKCGEMKSVPNQQWETDEEFIEADGVFLTIRKPFDTEKEFTEWLSQNPITIQYQTKTESIKTVDLHVINQDNNIVDSMYTFENITHVSTDADDVKPTVSSPNALEYSVVIKPNTQYTIFNSDNSSLLSYNLGGSYGNNSDEKVLITTPSALTSNTLRIERSGLKVSDLMVLEGNKKIIPYIEGMANASIKQIITTTNDDTNKTTILSFKNGLNLAKIGKNKDIFDVNNNILCRKIGRITLNGSENWEVSDDTTTNTVRYVVQEIIKDNPISTELYGVAHGANYENIYYIDIDGVILTNPNGHCYFRSTIRDLEQFKAWLQENPVTIQYVLANEINESVEYTIVDQDGNQVEKISSFDGSTNFKVVLDENSVNPSVEAVVKAKNSSTMNEISLAHEEINEMQRDIDDGINTQTNETDSTMMATTEIFENSL